MKTYIPVLILCSFLAGCSRPVLNDILPKYGISPSTVTSITVESTPDNPVDKKTVVLNSSQQKALWGALRSAGRPEDYIIFSDAKIVFTMKDSDSEPFLLYIDHYGVIHISSSKGGLGYHYSMEAYEIVNDALGGILLPPETP